MSSPGIRVMVAFSESNHVNKPVHICKIHLEQEKDDSKNTSYSVRTSLRITTLMKNRTRVSPYTPPSTAYRLRRCYYKHFLFQCYSLCCVIDQQKLQIIYTLEHEKEVLGRDVVKVKISTSPNRDARVKRNTQ